MTSTIEIIILAVQVVIVALQLFLSFQINWQNLSKNRGYFIPGTTNLLYHREEEKHRGRFDLTKSFPLDLTGNDAVNLLSYRIETDGKLLIDTRENYQPVFFAKEKDLKSFLFKFPLSEEELKQKTIFFTVSLRLENTSGYKYVENMLIGFEKDDDFEDWILNRLNINFSKN